MGTKTYSEFQSELLFELGRPNDDSLDSYKGNFINTAYMTLTTQNKILGIPRTFYFPELEVSEAKSTSDGVAYISVPSDCLVVRTLWDSSNDIKLTKISWRKYIGYTGRANADSEGKSTEWVRRGSYVYLYSTPDDTYNITVYYRKRPTALSDSDDTIAIGAEWDEPVLQLAVIQSHMRLGEFEKADKKKGEWVVNVIGILGLYDQEEFDREDVRKPHIAYLNFKY